MMGPSSQISKILLLLLILLLIFFIYMDVQLYMRIQNYPIERNYLTTNITSSSISSNNADITASSIAPASNADSYEAHTSIPCSINPLCHVTVKALLLDHTNHYLFGPLATIADDVIGFSRSFITPNMISYSHVVVACISGKLVASNSLGFRRLGTVLFQVRTFMDDLDGHVARVRKHIRGERSEIGTAGYYIDGLCDALGCIALVLGMFFYLKNNPPRRGYLQLPLSESSATKNTESLASRFKMKPSVFKVVKKVLFFSGQLLLSSMAWNRYIAIYQEMLENNDVTPAQLIRQNIVFKSTWFFFVAWMWRIVMVHSLMHCTLLSIFCDKLWEFLKLMQYSGYVVLLIVICATELHVMESQHFIYDSPLISNGNSSFYN